MRWKLLRRRLSVSAPRVMVRSHLPWPVRWAVAALMLGFSAAIALWAFEFGKDIAGLDRGIEQEVLQLRQDVRRLRSEVEQAQSVSNTAESLLKAEQAAQQGLAQQLRQLEVEKQALLADLGFFERLLPTGVAGPQLRGLQAEPAQPGQLRYQLLVMQNGKSPEFSGRFDLLLTGSVKGVPWTLQLPGGSQSLQLKQYRRLEGVIDHPLDAVIKTVQARILDNAGGVRATQTVKL